LCGRQLGSERAGMLAGFLYALAPLAAIHDRLAIPDSMLTMVGAFLLVASIRYARGATASRREALGIGALVAAAALVKLSGLLLAATPMLAVLILGAPDQRRWRLGQLRLSLIVALAALAMLAPFHYGGAERQKVVNETSRITLTMQNVGQIGNWLLRYLPGPLLILPLAGLAGSRRQDPGNPQETRDERRAIFFLLMTGLALPSAFAVVGGSLVSRYILPAWPALLLAAALGAQMLWQQGAWRIAARGLVGLGLGTAVLWGGFFGLRYSTDPRSTPLDSYDRWQYTQSWTAGYAMNPLISHVQVIAATTGPIRLVIQDQARLASLASQIYLSQNPQIELVSINLISANAPQQLHTLTAQGPTYLLADEQVVTAYKLQLRFPGLTPVQQLQNPGEKMSFWLFIQLP
ncbi:MAG: hypothetical protein HGA19_16260, partial [Oscillochloris sp.]|nr:hypothetical protein [Oscillochloris sp.]